MKKGKPVGGMIVSAVLPVLVFLIVFMGPKITQGNYTLLVSDLNGQYVNYFLYFKEAIAKGDNLFYSFSMLLGGDTLSLIGYYMLSPLNLILLLWPAEKIASGIFWMIALKVGLTGMTSFLFFTRKRGVQLSTLLFSTTYALSGYFFAYFMHVMWLDALYMLPLVITGLELLVEKKKKVLYIVSLAVAIVICYYTGYMIAGFSLLYFIYLQIKEKKNVKERMGEIGRFAWTSILAAALSAFSLFPVLLSQIGNRQAQEELTYGILHKITEIVSRLFTGAYNGDQFVTGAPQLYCGMLMIFLTILLFVSARDNVRKIVGAAVLLIPILASFCVGMLDIIWHGMAMPNSFTHRYAFVFVFALIVLAEECFADKTFRISLPKIIVTDVLVLLLAGLVWYKKPEWVNPLFLLIDMGVVIAMSVLFFLYKRGKKEKRVLLTCLLLGIQLVQLFVNGKSYVGIHNYDDHSSEGYYAAVKPIVEEVQAMDGGFYRMEKLYFNSTNDAMMLSYNGLSHFSSADKSYIRSFMSNLGYNKNFDFWVHYDKGATKAADSLLGVKYLLSSQPLEGYVEKKKIENQTLYENPIALEIGTVCSSQIKGLVPEEGKPFVNQQKLYDAMYGEPTDLFIAYEKPEIWGNNISSGEDAYVKVDGEKDGIVIFDFIAKDENPVYMYLPSVYNPGVQVCVNGEDKGEYLTAYHRGIFELGTFAEGERVLVELYLHGIHAGFHDIQIYGLYEERLYDVASTLKAQGWKVKEYNSAKIEAEISVEKDSSVLLITVPYNENWEITVDGKPAVVTEVMGALIAVDVSSGSHTVKMQYKPKGLLAGLLVSGVALAGLVVMIVLENRKRKGHEEEDNFFEVVEKEPVKEESEQSEAKGQEPEQSIDKKQEGDEKAAKFLEKEYEGCCQVCGKQIRAKDGSAAWSAYSLFEEIEDAGLPIAWNKICLCPICKTTFEYGEVSMKYFLPAVVSSMDTETETRKRFKILIGEEAKSISYSFLHLKNLQGALESKDGEKLMEQFRFK